MCIKWELFLSIKCGVDKKKKKVSEAEPSDDELHRMTSLLKVICQFHY